MNRTLRAAGLESFGLSRRRFMQLSASATAIGAVGIGGSPAFADSPLNFLGYQGYDTPLTTGDFLATAGINLNATYIGNNDEIIARLRGGGVGQIDIVTPWSGYIQMLARLDLIEEIDVSRLPNLEQVMPLFRELPQIHVDGKLYAVPFTWGSGSMIYDPAVFPVPPASWKDLLKPEYAGKVGMLDDPMANIITASMVVTGLDVPTRITSEQLEAAIDFLIAMKKQARLVAAAYGDLSDALSRGDIAVTFSGWEAMVKFCADKGKVVKFHYPEERTTAWLDNYCIVKDAPNLDAAYEACNRAISAVGQTRLGEDAFQGVVNSEAVKSLSPDMLGLYPYDDISGYGEKAVFVGMPPTEPEGDITSFTQWMKAYERFKAA